MAIDFGELERERYSRQILFNQFGKKAQEALANQCVLIAGCGGLGSVSSELLARAGVGKIKIVDRDLVELSNLQRQSLFDESDVKEGLPKAVAAKKRLESINSKIIVEAVVDSISRVNIESFSSGVNLVMDGTDNFETRFLINEICVRDNLPWIFGSCAGSFGMTMTVVPGSTRCFRCVFGKVPKAEFSLSSETTGVIAPIVNTIASWQSTEALKILTNHLDCINRDLVMFDIWKGEIDKINLSGEKKSDCQVCDYKQLNFLSGKYGSAYVSLLGENAVQIIPFEKTDVDLMKLAIELARYGDPKYNEYMLQVNIEGNDLTIFPNGRAVIKGTSDTGIARNIYKKYIVI